MEVVSVSLALRASTLVGTARIRDAIDAAGGTITRAHELSSWAFALTVELSTSRVEALLAQLAAHDVVWLDDGEVRLRSRCASSASEPPREIIVLMHVELINDDPERRLKIPAVPG